MLKFGFEIESFCRGLMSPDNPDPKPILVPAGLPYDECGWLVEVRSEPHHAIRSAIYLLKAEMAKVAEQATTAGVALDYVPLMEIPRTLKVQAARRYSKGLLRYKNIYGHETHRCSSKFATASLHISVTNEIAWHYTDEKGRAQVHKYNGFVDHAKLIVLFDREFKSEIAAAKRNPGFYEIKPDGRIEYRSLPNNVDLEKVREVLERFVA
jgi:hypothetical protein